MFDTPDLGPCCIAPWIAILAAVLILGIGPIIELKLRKKGFNRLWSPLIALLMAPIVCVVSVNLDIGAMDPAPWFEPAANDIAGEWELDAAPTDDLPKSAQVPEPAKELVFYKDGIFNANEIPDLWSYTDPSKLNHVSYISGSGNWYLGQVQGTQRLEWTLFTEFREINGRADSRTMRYYFQGHLPPYTLATLDSGYRIFHFQRK
jgi:hypothetical protein